jgi:4,5-DOPA dioxygenase extradiol
MTIAPSVFISHGTPMLALEDPRGQCQEDQESRKCEDQAVLAIYSFFKSLPKPRAVVVVSAHGVSPYPGVEVSADPNSKLFYDFWGFPAELYQVSYPCPGDPELAGKVVSLLKGAGFQASLRTGHQLDHGVWVPLKMAFPEANVPVVQVTMPQPCDPREVLKLGHALADLRKENVMILGSGGAVHNLERLVWHGKHGEAASWATAFEDWLNQMISEKNVEALLNFESEGPMAKLAHPTVEHLLPLFFALGAACPGDHYVRIFKGIQYHSLSMLSFALQQDFSPRLFQ